jgi:hypothetical protein
LVFYLEIPWGWYYNDKTEWILIVGMFDYISCEMGLPRLPERKEGKQTIISFPFKTNHLFQTKDLANGLIEYKIGKDKLLYEKKVEYEERGLTEEEKKDRDSGAFWHPGWAMEEKSHEWVKDNFTGYIMFYDLVHDIDSTHDAWIDYSVHVKNGEVQGDVELKTYRLEDNTESKANTEKWKQEANDRKEYVKKWRYKYCFKYWNRLVGWTFRKFRRILAMAGNLWKLERKLKF